MQQFMRKFTQLNGKKSKVILRHLLFGKQVHNCDVLHVINDNRIGLVLKEQEIYIDKHNVIQHKIAGNMYTISDGTLQMTIIVSRL